ncbi:restriction endonuclease subunit S [Streptomyces sp. NPDC006372]|uniref:restriction endonuclease subunit S n=1 Tax=Streptomyces sp. NPDC006372 TaxID=3155599 RepID=UPI00339E44D5
MTWKETRLKHLCVDSGQYGLNVPADHYSAAGTRLIRTSDIAADGTLRDAECGVHVDMTIEARHQLAPGDILLSRSGTLGRSFLIPEQAQGYTFAGFLIRFRPKPGVEPRFLNYATQSAGFQGTVHSEAVASTIQNFNADRYANISMRVPALEEQQRIADFLDAETAHIDQLVDLRSNQMQLVKEWYASTLDAAFSRDNHAPTRLKYLLASRPRYGVLVPQFIDGDGVRFIRVNDLLDLPGRAASLRRIPKELSSQYARTVTQAGDVLLSVVGTMGRSAIVPPELEGANVARAVASLRPRVGIPPELISAWLTTPEFMRQAALATSSDTAQPTLGMEDLSNFSLFWPDTPAAQRDLLRIIQTTQERYKSLTRAFQAQSRLFAERRQALINAAVTGQFDVSTASGRNVTEGVSV